jgi:hypothetical protein
VLVDKVDVEIVVVGASLQRQNPSASFFASLDAVGSFSLKAFKSIEYLVRVARIGETDSIAEAKTVFCVEVKDVKD